MSFSSYTTVITESQRFVGRKHQVARAKEWLLNVNAVAFPSFSICGLTRMGKTSLARQLIGLIQSQCNELAETIYYDASKSFMEGGDSSRFWRQLTKLTSVVKGLPRSQEQTNGGSPVDEFDHFEEVLNHESKRIVFFLDEFDRCLSLSDLSDFLNLLRSLINGSFEYKIQFVLISRRSPELIQSKSDGSTLPGTLQRIDLRAFSREEFQELVEIFCREEYPLAEVEVNAIWELTGGHPYLTNALLSELQDLPDNASNRIDQAYERASHVFESYFQEVLNFFDEIPVEERFQTNMVSTWRDCLFFERLYSRAIPPDTRTHMIRYGLSGPNAVIPPVFDSFLRQAVSASANWEELCRVEKKVRAYIDSSLCSYYQTDEWFNSLDIQTNDIWARDKKTGVDVFKETILAWFATDKKRSPGLNNRPIDFCYFDDLAGLMCMEQHWNPDKERNWKGFSSLFHGSKEDCRALMASFGAIRNPEAHSRDYPKDYQIKFSNARDKLDCILNDRIDQ